MPTSNNGMLGEASSSRDSVLLPTTFGTDVESSIHTQENSLSKVVYHSRTSNGQEDAIDETITRSQCETTPLLAPEIHSFPSPLSQHEDIDDIHSNKSIYDISLSGIFRKCSWGCISWFVFYACIISPSIIFWFIPPSNPLLLPPAFQLLGIFMSLIGFLMLTEISIGVTVGVTLMGLCLTRILACPGPDDNSISYEQCSSISQSFHMILKGFSEPVTWLIFSAFHIGTAIEKSGAAQMLSTWATNAFGSTQWGQGIAIIVFESILGIFIPSNTARGGGLVLPMVLSMIRLKGQSSHSQFLILLGAQTNLLVSSLFPTGAAPNPVVLANAKSILGIDYSYRVWILASSVPFIASCFIVPLILSYFVQDVSLPSPSTTYTPVLSEDVPPESDIKPIIYNSKLISTILICSLTLISWICGPYLGVPEAFVGLCSMMILVIADIITWNDITSNAKAWDTYFWLSGMLVLAEQMSHMGLSKWLGEICASFIAEHITCDPILSAMCLAVAYFLSTCLFSSITAHAIALVGPFMSASKILGCPPYLMTAFLASFSSLGASLTHFGTGSLVLYFSHGFVSRSLWYKASLCLSVTYILIAVTVGLLWWKVLGYY